eukprot:TRINITY_DN9918_c0_g2_i2.p1 TRINITY_DN9918_c0_g2~~TRINITY_DN9918_c0_g2_i2.p1  ORF type:complete len:364 (-),score=69.20 TRINITY_DN9918_c0_g2_i2:120-1211(-)
MHEIQRKDSLGERVYFTTQLSLLETENMHFKKNPFFHVPVVTEQKSHKAGENESGAFIVRCISGFKSKLKNKNWELIQPERPSQVGGSSLANLSFMHNFDSSQEFDCDVVSIDDCKTTSRQPSFEEEIMFIKTEIEFREKVSKEMLEGFKIVRSLPSITEEELAKNSVAINSRLVKTTDKTLVIELNNTLISYKDIKSSEGEKLPMSQLFTRHVSLRPGAMKLLNSLYKTYEAIIYTSLDKEFTTALIKNKLDKKGVIVSAVLPKRYCFKKNGYYIKDLRILKNRDLSKVIYLDSSVVSSCNQMDNSLIIPPYSSDKSDRVLYKVLDMLKSIANERDVRVELRRIFSLPDLYGVYLKEEEQQL